MDKSAYQRAHVSRRRRYPNNGSRNSRQRSGFFSFLLACTGIFIFAVCINYLFPHFSKAVGDKVSTVVDYRAAFAVIGEGISGEKKLRDALSEAWVEAFNTEHEDTAVTGSFEPTPEIKEPTPDIVGGGSELTDALLAAFSESQMGYADYMTPAGIDYAVI